MITGYSYSSQALRDTVADGEGDAGGGDADTHLIAFDSANTG